LKAPIHALSRSDTFEKMSDAHVYTSWKTRLFNGLPSWVYLLAGLGLLGATVLVPAWLDLKDIRWQRDALQAEVESYKQQVQRYERFSAALDRRDPGLIQRLAQQQFNLSTPGERVMTLQTVGVERASQRLLPDPYCVDPLQRAAPVDGIDALLARTAPAPPPDPKAEPIRASMIVRLTTGEHRMGLVAVGGIFFFVGLWRQVPIVEA